MTAGRVDRVRTRIVATLGPATSSEEGVRALIDAGVDLFRINSAHGTVDEHAAAVRLVRRVAGDRHVAVLQDLGGPKLRLDHPVKGAPGDVVDVNLPASVRPGDPVLLADGLMHLEVVEGRRCRVIVGGDIPPGKGINLPSSCLDIPSLTDKDLHDLRGAVESGVDFVAMSFVRRASDLEGARTSGLPVIAKIEKAEAVTNLEEIVEAADGIMVARGDLGVEIPIERVPAVQKRIIALANRAAKPVITATQMMRSMVESRMPTRAEATDVANAVWDGTDAVMLSEETAIGKYPVEAVRVMDRILAEAEPLLVAREERPGKSLPEAVSHAACALARQVDARGIVVLTRSGFTARHVARWRPRVPVLALVPDEGIRRRMALVWGVSSAVLPEALGLPELLGRVRERVFAMEFAPPGAPVVVVAGWQPSEIGAANLVHVMTL